MRVRGIKAGIELVGREGYCLRAAEAGGREMDGSRQRGVIGEKVIGGPVFLHDNDDVLERQIVGLGEE